MRMLEASGNVTGLTRNRKSVIANRRLVKVVCKDCLQEGKAKLGMMKKYYPNGTETYRCYPCSMAQRKIDADELKKAMIRLQEKKKSIK